MSENGLKFVTLDQLATWCRTDADDLDLLPSGRAAEQACLDYLDRAVFLTAEELASAKQDAPADVAAAAAARDAALIAASSFTGEAYTVAMEIAVSDFSDVLQEARKIREGCVVNDSIVAGVLLTAASVYRNRENNVTGVSAAAVEIPQDAKAFLRPHRRGLGL